MFLLEQLVAPFRIVLLEGREERLTKEGRAGFTAPRPTWTFRCSACKGSIPDILSKKGTHPKEELNWKRSDVVPCWCFCCFLVRIFENDLL